MAVLWVKPLYREKTVYIKTLFIFVGYGNDRFFPFTNPYILNVTQHCRCLPMLADAHISSLGYLWEGLALGRETLGTSLLEECLELSQQPEEDPESKGGCVFLP